LEPLRPADFLQERPVLNEQIFRHVERYRHLYEVLLSERGAALARHRLMAYLTSQVEHFLLRPLLALVGEPAVPISLLASYVSGTLYTAITWWLEHPLQKTPEEMGQLVRKLTLPAIFAVLGVAPEQLVSQGRQAEQGGELRQEEPVEDGRRQQEVVLLSVDERFPCGGSEVFPSQGACAGTSG
jgi:hypothetical protein